jgi:probable F420-dependent oxidoreductase
MGGSMKFSIALPTADEGLTSPIPFVNHQQLIEIAQLSEKLGYHSVWGNDHFMTQEYVKRKYKDPPKYYELLITLAVISAYTSKLGLGTSILVLPMREPVLLSKQLATLDQFSNGRLLLGVGVGAYREEFKTVFPQKTEINRGELLEEVVQALKQLFTERETSFWGKYVQFNQIETNPKPQQKNIPFYFGGNSTKAIERTARWGVGWMPAGLTPDDLGKGVSQLKEFAEKNQRSINEFDIAPQYGLYLANNRNEAIKYFKNSQGYQHLLSLKDSTFRSIDIEGTSIEGNLIGTPQDVIDKIGRLKEAGMTHCAAICFDTNTNKEMIEQIYYFAQEVMPAFN